MSKSYEDRLSHVAKQYNVFDDEGSIEYPDDSVVTRIEDDAGLYAIMYTHDEGKKNRVVVYTHISIFSKFIYSDPTPNKQCVQWMLRTFVNLIKNQNSVYDALRFVHEDLSRLNEYMRLFEENKNKARFLKLCEANSYLSDVRDYKDINSYSSMIKLFEAVDPFIEKDVSGLRREISRYVDAGEAEVVYSDASHMIYIPKTRSSAEIFSNYVTWCTSGKGNGMFNSYTTNHKRGDKSNSVLYVIIPKPFFDGFTDSIYQIHFETNQFMARNNVPISPESVDSFGDGVRDYIMSRLTECINSSSSTGRYKTFAKTYGFYEVVFNEMSEDREDIRIIKTRMSRVPDTIGKFKNVKYMAFVSCGLKKISNRIGELTALRVLSLNDNKISVLPSEICKLRSLEYLSIIGSGLVYLPDSISELDVSRGGNLKFVSCDKVISGEVAKKLPSCVIL